MGGIVAVTPEEWQMPLIVTAEAEQAASEGRLPIFTLTPEQEDAMWEGYST